MSLLITENLVKAGTVMCNADGSMMSSYVVDQQFKPEVARLQDQCSDLIEPVINIYDDF